MKSLVSSLLFGGFVLGVTTTAYAQALSPPIHPKPRVSKPIGSKPIMALPERQAQVFVGSSDYAGLPTAWEELADPAHYSQWNYVRTHANGFYTNFAMMDHVFAHSDSPVQMAARMAAAFTHKAAFYETDMNYPEAEDERNLACLTAGGFQVPCTSLNYGISPERVHMLKTDKGERECLALMGPWTLGGNIGGNAPGNAALRENINATEGMSADSPLRLWYNDDSLTREGLYSAVIFTHQRHKLAAVMLAPPDANDRPGYGGPSFLVSSQRMVFDLEDHGAVPDIWGVYPYGALPSLAAFPESVVDAAGDTVAPDTKTGVAYWLLKHFNTFPQVTLLRAEGGNTGASVIQKSPSQVIVSLGKGRNGAAACTLPFVISNGSAPGIALSPVVQALVSRRDGWNIQFRLGGANVTEAVVQDGGLNFVGSRRISKQHPATLELRLQATQKNPPPVTIQLQTLSNLSNTALKRISFTLTAKVR